MRKMTFWSSDIRGVDAPRQHAYRLVFTLLVAFLILSWPFIFYPLTDGDMAHWVRVVTDIRQHHHWLTSMNDQSHGPLLAWLAAVLSYPAPYSNYLYGMSGILPGILLLGSSYFFCLKSWRRPELALWGVIILSTSLAFVYLARTPMYDFLLAVFYFIFAMCYFYYLTIGCRRYMFFALLCLGLASLCRFSLALLLSMMFVITVARLLKKDFGLIVKHSFMVVLVALCFNLPWVWGQLSAHGPGFLHVFWADNVGRFVKEPGLHAVVNHQYYAFLFYILVGMLPYTPLVLASFFQEEFFTKTRNDIFQKVLLAGWLPGFLICSFSGHPKLGRYIAFVFPFLALMSARWISGFDLTLDRSRLIFRRFSLLMLIILCVSFFVLIQVFFRSSGPGLFLTMGLILVEMTAVAGLYGFAISRKTDYFRHAAYLLLPALILYGVFFTLLAVEAQQLDSLIAVNASIRHAMGVP